MSAPHDYADHGIELTPGAAGEARAPCPQCGPQHRRPRDPCLAVNLDLGVWVCHRCGWKGRLRMDRAATAEPRPPAPPALPDRDKAARLARIWREARPLGDPAAAEGITYLRARGLGELVDAHALPGPDALRFHPRLAYVTPGAPPVRLPALVARVVGRDGAGVTLHRTYLEPGGARKAAVTPNKKLMPVAVRGALRGAAVRLYPAGTALAVGEGLETALALRLILGIPAWSTVSAWGMQTLELPADLAELVIGGDHDPTGVGERAARALAARARAAGIPQVRVAIPRRRGADWLDELAREAA